MDDRLELLRGVEKYRKPKSGNKKILEYLQVERNIIRPGGAYESKLLRDNAYKKNEKKYLD
ncbi:MAG: hypothetical protein B6U78_01910 [Candidatus Aenigmarchaeota archaeon ex4484_224]|nr:MAG: hypothetical protein B6U78_01910 [Candidatus Aenigmarchaeota archaeon ex4484_224]